MLIENNIVVFDCETNGLNIQTCDVLQIACLALDPIKLSIIPGSKFNTYIRPDKLDEFDNTHEKKQALSICKITKDMLKNQPVAKAAITAFAAHIKKVCGRRRAIPCGYNIINFDLPIYNRLCKQFNLSGKDGLNPSFLTSFIFDMKNDINNLFFQDERLLYPSFDNLRKLLGMKVEGAHRADFDVNQEAWVAKKLLMSYKRISPMIKFEGSAKFDGGILTE